MVHTNMFPHILWRQSRPPPVIWAPAGGLRKCTARSYCTPLYVASTISEKHQQQWEIRKKWKRTPTWATLFGTEVDTKPHISRHIILANWATVCVWVRFCCRFGLWAADRVPKGLTPFQAGSGFIHDAILALRYWPYPLHLPSPRMETGQSHVANTSH